jgi:hypothetical protein
MKQTIVIFTLLVASTLLSSLVLAETQADKYLGEKETCLNLTTIKETRILDEQTILFETYGGTVYINRLPAQCFGLRISGSFSYETSISKLCKWDIITVFETGSGVSAKCGLGEFIQIKGVSRLSEGMKLLEKNGILEALVEEGVFETAFPTKKSE